MNINFFLYNYKNIYLYISSNLLKIAFGYGIQDEIEQDIITINKLIDELKSDHNVNQNTFINIKKILDKHKIALGDNENPLEKLESLREKLKGDKEELKKGEELKGKITDRRKESEKNTKEEANKKLKETLKKQVNDEILNSDDYDFRKIVEEAITVTDINLADIKQVAFLSYLHLDANTTTQINKYMNGVDFDIKDNNGGKILDISFKFDTRKDKDKTEKISLNINNGKINPQEFITKLKDLLKSRFGSFDPNYTRGLRQEQVFQ